MKKPAEKPTKRMRQLLATVPDSVVQELRSKPMPEMTGADLKDVLDVVNRTDPKLH
jgi:hypothetical protein